MIMISKLFLLLTISHSVLTLNGFWNQVERHTHWKLTERTYDTRPLDIPDGVDVGRPLILTSYIKAKRIKEARRAARVDDRVLLPGIKSYAGYLTVNETYNGNLWFWYFPVSNKPIHETPLIIWLQGGPGATSLFGLFKEIGPFFAIDNHTLKENEYSWGKDHSLLFIDNPVGAGFSFTDSAGYATTQTTIGENLYDALQQFLTIFSELRTAPLFIAGESYAGKHIPSLGIQIHWHKGKDQPINLQGMAIGNGFIDPITLQRYSYFFREIGIVDDNNADAIKSLEANVTEFIKNNETLEAFLAYGNILQTFDTVTNLSNIYNYLTDDVKLFDSFTEFVQRPALRRALHVGNTTFSRPGKVYFNLLFDVMNSAKPWLEELLNHYRVLVYSGHLDCIVPYHASVNTYQSLKYSGADEYKEAKRFSWNHDNTVAGYIKTGGLLTEVMVRGAGHMVPVDKPAPALGLISAFIRGLPLNYTSTPVF